MKKRNIGILLSMSIFAFGCAEKRTRIWIDPPVGSVTDKGEKLVYQVEDINSGRKENISIPIRQMPDHFVVEDPRKKKDQTEFALATQADRQIQEGKLEFSPQKGTPTVSYVRGIAEVESLYQSKQYSEALVRLAPMIEQYPQQSRLYMMQGTLFRKMGEKKLALDAYKKAQELDKGNAAVEEAVLKSQDEMGRNL